MYENRGGRGHGLLPSLPTPMAELSTSAGTVNIIARSQRHKTLSTTSGSNEEDIKL